MQKNENKKKLSPGQIISLAVLVLIMGEPELIIEALILGLFVSPIALVVWLVIRHAKKRRDDGNIRNVTYTRKTEALDDCPKQLFCFHKDKGEHHVARGKEIDPWDRPDIDVRKYQRKE